MNRNHSNGTDKNGSETVKITGSILAQTEGAQAALQASRNAKVAGCYDIHGAGGFVEIS